MSARDTVATALTALSRHTRLELEKDGRRWAIALREDIPVGHKFALERMAAGDPVRKYGQVIGTAIRPIEAGELVHVHNVGGNRGRGDMAARSGEEGGGVPC